MIALLETLLARTDASPSVAAGEVRSALRAVGDPLGRLLASAWIESTDASRALAPVAALEHLVDPARAGEDAAAEGLRRATEVVSARGSDASLLGRALRYPVERDVTSWEQLETALEARSDERRLGHCVSRAELTRRLAAREGALASCALRCLGAATPRREALVERAVVARGLALGLARFGPELEAGRTVLTTEDLERRRVPATDLTRRPTSPALRQAIAEQVVWAREQLGLAWALPQDLGPQHAPWAAAWMRRTETRLRWIEAADFDLAGRTVAPTAGALDWSAVVGLTWWLPPRSVVDR